MNTPETTQVRLAAHFEECARMLRAHPELFDVQSLQKVGVVAGLSTRVTRLAARRRTWDEIFADVLPGLFRSVALGTKDVPELLASRSLVAGAWRALRRIEQTERARKAALPRYAIDANAVGGPTLTSPCPSCGAFATRSLLEPSPCSACGFVFQKVEVPDE